MITYILNILTSIIYIAIAILNYNKVLYDLIPIKKESLVFLSSTLVHFTYLASLLIFFIIEKFGLVFISPEFNIENAEKINNIKLKNQEPCRICFNIPQVELLFRLNAIKIFLNWLFNILKINPYIQIKFNIDSQIYLEPIVPNNSTNESDDYVWDVNKKIFKIYMHEHDDNIALPDYEKPHIFSIQSLDGMPRKGQIDMKFKLECNGNLLQKFCYGIYVLISFFLSFFGLKIKLCYNPVKLKIEN